MFHIILLPQEMCGLDIWYLYLDCRCIHSASSGQLSYYLLWRRMIIEILCTLHGDSNNAYSLPPMIMIFICTLSTSCNLLVDFFFDSISLILSDNLNIWLIYDIMIENKVSTTINPHFVNANIFPCHLCLSNIVMTWWSLIGQRNALEHDRQFALLFLHECSPFSEQLYAWSNEKKWIVEFICE